MNELALPLPHRLNAAFAAMAFVLAAVIGATAHNTNAPRWMAVFMPNQNLHAVHHDRPELHWNALPGAFGKSATRFSGPYLALLLRQFRGPRRSNAAIPAE